MPVNPHALASDPKHLKGAFRDLGMREVPGNRDNPRVLEMFRTVGHAWVEHDETAWCAAAVGTWLAEANMPFLRSLGARPYAKWGTGTQTPKRGDVVVMKRGNSSWQGHVALYLGTKAGRVYVIGGNQRDSVSVTSYPLSKVIAYRTPTRLNPITGNSRTTKGVALAGAGGSLNVLGEMVGTFNPGVGPGANGQTLHDAMSGPIGEAGYMIQNMGAFSTTLYFVGGVLIFGGLAWAAYARYTDWKRKGV